MQQLRPRLAVLMICLCLMAGQARAGKVGGTMARYALAGAGIGALLGGASATVPYLNDHQPFDFSVGAGAGALAGTLGGLIFGIVDLATDQGKDDEGSAALKQQQWFAFQGGRSTYLAWKCTF